MRKILFTITGTLLALMAQSQGIYNNGARIASGTGSWWVVDGNFTLTSESPTNLASMANLKIVSGASLTLTPATCLSVTGTLTNDAGTEGLVIRSASGGDGKLINNTPSVSATVELYLTGGTVGGNKFHFFVPPVTSMTIGSDSTAVKTNLGLTRFKNDLMSYSELAAGANQNLGWQYYDGYIGSTGFTAASFTSLTSSVGYNIYLPANDKITFKGTLNATPHTFSLNRSTNCLGWNLVGNPYPCNFNLAGISALTTADNGVDKSVYFSHNGGYAVWNVFTKAGDSGYSDTIPPMQGFFVHVTASDKTLTLPAVSKTFTGTTPRSKGTNSTEENSIEKIKLVLSNSTVSDETIVCLIDKATSGFDGEYDAYKLFGNSTTLPDIYTELSSVKYAINSVQSPVSDPVKIPVTVVLKTPGTYKIDISEFENLEGVKVVLKHGAVETNLSKNTGYSFTSAAGTFANFELIFGSSATGVENPVNEKLKTWYSNNFLYINCPGEITTGNGSLVIYDMHGKQVYNNNQMYLTPEQTMQLPLTLPKGVYVTRVTVNNQSFVSKIVAL